ncbi:nucleoside hydrolase [Streptomyces sp. 8N114]|uniref:nucleoside hydrolase n=1 Tax=Streptomyces sp. 8N114 TaxID=3457419 RepID=UPI003FCFF001
MGRRWETTVDLGNAVPGGGLAEIGEQLQTTGPWLEDLRHSPLIIDTDIGGDADDALAVAVAARHVPELAAVITGDEAAGQRARFARHLLDAMGRSDVATVAGASLGATPYYCVDDLIPQDVPPQPTDVVAAVREVCASTTGPVRWVGIAPLSNLARVLAEAPEVAAQLRVTQMGGALRYRNPERAEHNVRLDVPAAQAVLAAVAEGRLTTPEFIPSEVTFTPQMEVTANSALYEALNAPNNPPWARILSDHLDRWFRDFHPGSMQHDALTLSAALDLPFVDSELMPITMDRIGRTTAAEHGEGAVLRWSTSAAYVPFMSWLTEALNPSKAGTARLTRGADAGAD